MKREEARLIAEAEAKEKALEDAEEARLEKLRVEQEKRDKKKQKDKVIRVGCVAKLVVGLLSWLLGC